MALEKIKLNKYLDDIIVPKPGTINIPNKSSGTQSNSAIAAALGSTSPFARKRILQNNTDGSGSQNTTTQATQKKSSGGRGGGAAAAAPAPTNPYAGQIAAAQSAMSGAAKPVYTAPAATAAKLPTYTDSYGQRINDLEAQGPGSYESRYQPMIDKTLNQLQNRRFQYNMSEDPLYRQYAAQYAQKGRQAMQDTMGQAAALTGGYGSSYASTAGNQAYQQYLGQLNDKALDLYSLARQSYDADGSDMRANLSSLQTAEGMDRNNFESDRADYYNRLAALRQGQSAEYQRYQDQLEQYNTDRQLNADAENQAWSRYMDEQALYCSHALCWA